MSSLTKPLMNIENNASKDSPVVVEIKGFKNNTTAISTTKIIVDADADVDANNNNNNNNAELARMKDELQQLRRDRDHWRETAISNLAIETSKMKTRSSSPPSSNSENNNSNNNSNNDNNDSNRKRHGVPSGCDDNSNNNNSNNNNNNNNLKGIKQFRSQYATSTDAAAVAVTVAQHGDEDDETTKTDGTVMMHFESSTPTTNKRQKRMSKDDIQKSFHLMIMERHLKSAMIYASKGDKNLMLYSIKHAEKHDNKKNSNEGESSSCNNEIFLNKVAKIKQTINKDLEKSFHKNIMERQLRSAMAHAIRGDRSTVEYFLKEAEINARKCCCNDINRDDDDEGNDDDDDDCNYGDYSYKFFQERVTKIQEEIKRTIHGQHAL
jgi:hypothetical protein